MVDRSGTPGLPRVSRIFLYLGYVLLTVTVVNWALTAHDLSTLGRFTGGTALDGLARYGRPMLYAIAAVTLARPPVDEPSPDGTSSRPPDVLA